MQLVLYGLLFVLHLSIAAKPWEPSVGVLGNWNQLHEELLKTTKEHKTQIKAVFVGDSITAGWAWDPKEWGFDVWTKYYAPRNAYNYGIGGDTTGNVIWRIENGEFDGLNPKVVVVMIGTNNIGRDPDDDIAEGVKAVVTNLEKKMPDSKIILLGVLPRQGVPQDTSVQHINTAIAKLNDNKTVNYLDMGSHGFRASLGNVNQTVYRSDQLHINNVGYALWHQLMENLFVKLLNS